MRPTNKTHNQQRFGSSKMCQHTRKINSQSLFSFIAIWQHFKLPFEVHKLRISSECMIWKAYFIYETAARRSQQMKLLISDDEWAYASLVQFANVSALWFMVEKSFGKLVFRLAHFLTQIVDAMMEESFRNVTPFHERWFDFHQTKWYLTLKCALCRRSSSLNWCQCKLNFIQATVARRRFGLLFDAC